MQMWILVAVLLHGVHVKTLQEGLQFLEAGQFGKAEQKFQEVLLENPDYLPALKALAEVKIRLNQLQEARDLLKKVVTQDPRDLGAMVTLADVYSWLGDYDRSIALYKDVIEQDSTNLAALKGLGRVLRWAQRYDESIHYYRKVLEVEPDDVGALKGLALSYALYKNFDEALKWIEKAVELYPDNPDVLKTKGDILAWSNHFKEAERVYRLALKVSPKSPDIYQSLGSLYKWWGKYTRAVEAYEKAYNLQPNNPQILQAFAQTALKAGQLKKAETAAEKLLQLDPQNETALSILHTLQAGQGITFYHLIEEVVEPIVMITTLLLLVIYFRRRQDILRRRHRFFWIFTHWVVPTLFLLLVIAFFLLKGLNLWGSDIAIEVMEILIFIVLLLGVATLLWVSRTREREVGRAVLAIGAHPDDIELGCGGTLAKYKDLGYKVYAMVMTSGEEGVPDPEKHRERQKEATQGAHILGIDQLWIYRFKDTELSKHINEMKKEIEKKIQETGATVIITQSPYDTHQDHKAVFEATKIAARGPKVLLCYEDVSTEPHFVPNFFVYITEYIEDKIEAIQQHRTQRNKSYMNPENIRGRAAHRGLQVGVKYAEAFICMKWVDT